MITDIKDALTSTNNRLDKQADAFQEMMRLNQRLLSLIEIQKQLTGDKK